MNKKFISAFMLGLLALGTTSTITSCKDYDGDLSDVKNSVNSLTNDLKALQDAYKAADTALETKIANAEAALKDAIAKKADQTTVDALKSNLESNYYQKSVIDSKLEAIEKIINDTKTQLNADIVAKYNALQGEIAGVDKKLGDKYSDLLEQITYIYGDLNERDNELEATIDAVKADLDLQTAALAGAEVRIAAIEAMLADYPAVKAQVADNKEKIAKLISDLNAANSNIAANCATMNELAGEVQKIQGKIDAVSPALDGLSICVSKRPTSIVFEPTTFVNGIEAISFSTLSYKDWGKQTREESRQGYPENDNWYADAAPANAKLTYIDKDNAIAEYRVNPILGNNQWEQSVAEISTLVHKATNEISRAADYENLITVSETKYENGVLTVKLHKNTTEDLGDKIENIGLNKDKETFNLMSIKAQLTDKALTAEEKANNALVYVYSDWCRIVQETVQPYIHQKNSNFHFLRFSDIYNDGNLATTQTKRDGALKTSEVALVTANYAKDKIDGIFNHYKTYGNRCIEVKYNETLDLKELVSVCTNHATIQDYKARGLDFMFNLVQLDVWDSNINSYTDESSYAVIENGVIRATGIKGEVGKQLSDGVQNVSAVGRTPVVQIVLMDKANDQVVDVQYMMIRWINPAENEPVPALGQDDATKVYGCGITQITKVLDLEQYFTNMQLTNQQFRALYGHVYDNKIYSTNEIKAGVPQGKVIGTASYYKGDADNTTSDQIQWTVTSDENSELVAQLKANGKAEVTGYILLTSAPGASPTKAIKVTATFTYDLTQHKVASYANGVNYIEGQWTKNGGELNTENENKYITCSVLPYEAKSIYADYKTTVIGHDVATGFIQDGKSFSTVNDNYKAMFANKTDAQLVFDNKEERLEILKSEGFDVVGAAGWNVSSNGKTLYYGNVVAATIDGTQVKLAESYWAQAGSVLNKPARALLGKKVAVKFNADYIYFCDETKNTVVDKFLVYFEKPLTWTEKDVVIAFTDQTHYGDVQKANLDELFTVTEAWGNNTNVVWGVQPTGQNPTVAELKAWYGIKQVEFEHTSIFGWAGKEWKKLDDAKTNFNKNGGIDSECKTLLSDLKNQDGTQKYLLLWNGEQGENARFIFFEQTNAGGTSQTLSQQLVVEVNAYLAGKYFLTENNNKLTGKVKVTVDPKQTSKKK